MLDIRAVLMLSKTHDSQALTPKQGYQVARIDYDSSKPQNHRTLFVVKKCQG